MIPIARRHVYESLQENTMTQGNLLGLGASSAGGAVGTAGTVAETVDRQVRATSIDAAPATAGAAGSVHGRGGNKPRVQLAEALRSWLGSALVIAAMIVIFSIAQPRFMTLQNWQNIAIQMSVLLVISVAGTLPILIGSIDLSVGSVATLAGIVTALSLQHGGLAAALAVPIGLAVGVGCGLLNGLLLALVRIPSFLVTLGTFFALDGLASWIISGAPIPISNSGQSRIFDASWGVVPTIFVWSLIVLIAAVAICRYSRIGRHFYAIGGSEPAALIAGINVKFVKVAAFALSGLLASFSGFLLSVHTLSGSPQQSAGLLLPSIGAIVIGGTALSGGVGGPHRTLIGVLLLTILINGMQLLSVDPYLQLVVEGAVVIIAVIMSRQKLSVFAAVK
jgi:ribose/xylose/arabinose/galactoside ABC-type transport system permease subunit